MADAITVAKQSEGVTSVVLICDQETTVQHLIDVATLARATGLPAFYRQGGELKHIEVEVSE